MPTSTPNYALQKPVVGADDDLWGGYVNDSLDIIDTEMKANADAIAAIEAFPVGGVYISVTGINPELELGYGTWSAFAEGRVLVGVGSNGEATWTGGEERGSETHTLTEAELPGHTHGPGTLSGTTSSDGAHTHIQSGQTIGAGGTILGTSVQGVAGAGNLFTGTPTASDGAHTHTADMDAGVTGSTGSGTAHNNVQPSIGVYMWQRTA